MDEFILNLFFMQEEFQVGLFKNHKKQSLIADRVSFPLTYDEWHILSSAVLIAMLIILFLLWTKMCHLERCFNYLTWNVMGA